MGVKDILNFCLHLSNEPRESTLPQQPLTTSSTTTHTALSGQMPKAHPIYGGRRVHDGAE